ncbi:MAG: hypothetical protein IT432_12595 [Phycisphaerales bacterium]|nr:hypothetical protein [Phycisphaerales bacterium]
MSVSESEIVVGLVLHMNPTGFGQDGASCTCAKDLQVQGGHFFLCVSVSGKASRWVPLYSNPGDGRTAISVSGRNGHTKWTKGVFYWHQEQIWTLTPEAVDGGASAGDDRSSVGRRNTLHPAQVPTVNKRAA